MLNNPFYQLAAPNKGEGKQDFLKRCMDGDETRIAACTDEWNQARLAAFIDDNQVTLSAESVRLEQSQEGADSGPRRFAILAHTGKVIDWGWLGRFIIDLSGIRVAKDAIPALLDHCPSQRLGIIDGNQTDTNGFYVMGRFLSNDLAQGVLADADEEFPFQASIGVHGLKVLYVDKGETHKVNGRTVEGPLDVWLESEVYETSIVTFGADDDTAAIAMHRAGSRKNTKEDTEMDPKLKKALVGLGLPVDATDEQAVKFLAKLDEDHQAKLDGLKAEIAELKKTANPTPAVDPAAPVAQLSGPQVMQLQTEYRKVGLDADMVNEALGDGKLSMAQAREKLINAAGEVNQSLGTGRIDMGTDETDKVRLAMADGVSLRLGMAVESPAAGHEEFRAMSLSGLGRFCLHRAGVAGVSTMSREQVAREVMRLSAGVSTSDFGSVFRDVTNKRLLQAYAEAPDTYTPWVNTVPANDFKTIYGIALSEAPTMDLVDENGEYKAVHLSDSQESYTIQKRGFLIPLTYEMIVNDDLRAFLRIPQLIGSSSRRTIADSVYGTLTGATTMSDGKALFHADHGNLETVSGNKGVVDSDKLDAGRVGMRTQTGIGGATLDLTPRFLLVPVAQETSADVLLHSAALPDANMSAGVKNPWAGKLQPIAEPRLDAVSTKAWYLAADPGQIDTIELAFLDGQSEPTVEEHEEYRSDSLVFKGRIIYGVGCMDYRGLRKNPGE